MPITEFRPGQIEDDVLRKIDEETSTGLKMGRPILSRFKEHSNNQVFSLEDPTILREEIFDFYFDQAERYDKIRNQHVMPLKKMLEYLEEKAEEENSWNMRMVRDTIKPSYFQNQIPKYSIDELDQKILTSQELDILRNKFEGDSRFIIELFLETTAKIGAIASIKHGDLPNSRTDNYQINFRKQYKENDGVIPLQGVRNRSIKINEEVVTLYLENYDKDGSGYIFAQSAKKSYSLLRSKFREINQELEFKITPNILRDTGAFQKLDLLSEDELKHKMGIKTDSRIEKYRKIKDKRES